MHQNTKSARLIALCKRSLKLQVSPDVKIFARASICATCKPTTFHHNSEGPNRNSTDARRKKTTFSNAAGKNTPLSIIIIMGKPPPPIPEPELRKGLVWEMIFFMFLQGMDVGAAFGIYLEGMQASSIYGNIINYKNSTNETSPYRPAKSIGYCTTTEWDMEKVHELYDLYGLVLNIYMFFLGIAGLIFFLHFCMWVVAILLSLTKIDFITEQMPKVVTGKIIFSLCESFIHDIPISCIAIELYLLRRGSQGLVCYLCSHSPTCNKADHIDDLLSGSSGKLSFLLFAIGLTTTWKGLTSMFRFSRTGVIDIFIIRAVVSLFAAGIYIIVILTPAMVLLKYRYYTLPGVNGGFFADIIDRVMIIGALLWIILLMGGCCCPLMSMIKLD